MDRYRDRHEAGARLLEVLAALPEAEESPVILGIPRGGVVVGEVVADGLGADFDVLGVEKVGAPWNTELAVGAVGEGDVLWLDPELTRRVDAAALQRAIQRERAELEEKLSDIRAVWPRVPLAERIAIVVDDGVATGATVHAALTALRGTAASRCLLAVPVGAPAALAELEAVADAVVCPLRPVYFQAVGAWYDVFDQVGQHEVVRIFRNRDRPRDSGPRGPY